MNSSFRSFHPVKLVGTLLALLVSGNAAAQDSPAPCNDVSIDEIFVGSPGCEDADYVLVSLAVDSDWPSWLDLSLSNACGQDNAEASYELEALNEDEATQRGTVLVAGSDFERFFGIRPDVVLDGLSPLSRSGGAIVACDVSFELNFRQTRLLGEEALTPGDGRDGGAEWIRTTPRPFNRNGEIGTLRGCGGNDGGIVPPAERLACDSLPPQLIEGGVLTPFEAGVTSEPTASSDTTATEPPDEMADSGPKVDAEPRRDAGPPGIEDRTSDTTSENPRPDTETVPTDVSEADGGTSEKDGGASASTATGMDAGKQVGVQLREVNDAEGSDGCACRVGSRQSAGSSLGALLAVMLGLTLRRRRALTRAA